MRIRHKNDKSVYPYDILQTEMLYLQSYFFSIIQ